MFSEVSEAPSSTGRRSIGARWCKMVHMALSEKPVRQSVSIPSRLARKVLTLAKRQRSSANRVLVELIEAGLEAKEAKKRKFFELADRLTTSDDADESRRLKQELARMTFGE
jgi:hypothetical protein